MFWDLHLPKATKSGKIYFLNRENGLGFTSSQSDIIRETRHLPVGRRAPRIGAAAATRSCASVQSAVHKASRDASRFPELEAIIVPLLHKRLASDTNVDLLFGRVSHVRGLLLEHGPNVAHPPPRNSRSCIFAAIHG